MKRIVEVLIGLFILLMAASAAEAQEPGPEVGNVVFFQTGYTGFALPKLHKNLDHAKSYYTSEYYLPMQKLTDFPGNWIVGGSYAGRVAMPIWLTLGGYVTQTEGNIGYRDMNGKLTEEMRVHLIYLNAGVQFDAVRSGASAFFIAVHSGILHTRIDTRDAAEFYQLSKYNQTSESTHRSTYLAFDVGAGIETRVLGTVIALECSYRVNQYDENNSYGEDFTDDFGGLTVSSRLGIPLSW